MPRQSASGLRPTTHAIATVDASVAADRLLGVVLAGVHAWGQTPLDRCRPRTLWPIGVKPLMQYPLEWLKEHGVREVIVCANSNTPDVRDCFGDGESLGLDLRYFDDPSPRGPAGCVRDAAKFDPPKTCVVIEGTLLPQFNLRALLRAHDEASAAVTVGVVRSEHGNPLEPPEPAGIYIFSPQALLGIGLRGYQDIKESLLPRLHAAGECIVSYEIARQDVERVSDVESYFAATVRMAGQASVNQASGCLYVRRQDAWIHRSATVHPSARLVGAIVVGPRVEIGPRATVVGPAAVGSGSVMGADSIVANSFLWSTCEVKSGASVSHSVLLDSAMVREGCVICERILPRRSRIAQWHDRWQSFIASPPRLSSQRLWLRGADGNRSRIAAAACLLILLGFLAFGAAQLQAAPPGEKSPSGVRHFGAVSSAYASRGAGSNSPMFEPGLKSAGELRVPDSDQRITFWLFHHREEIKKQTSQPLGRTPVPLPKSVWLGALGLAGLLVLQTTRCREGRGDTKRDRSGAAVRLAPL